MEKIFVDGWMWQAKHDKAPDFVKGHILINIDRHIEWLKSQKEHASEKGWVKVDIKDSTKGSRYFELNTWKPEKERKEELMKDEAPHPLDNIPF